MSRWVSFGLLLGIIGAVGLVFYRVMADFLLPMFLAAILVILFRPLHELCLRRWPGHRRRAAIVTIAAVILLVIIPTTLVTTLAAVEASTLASRIGSRDQMQKKVDDLRKKLELEYEFAQEIRYLESSLEILEEDAGHGATAHGDAAAYRRLMDAMEQLGDGLHEHQRNLKSWQAARDAFGALQKLGEDPAKLGSLAYQTQLRSTSRALREFKLELLGGEFQAWLIELTNPRPEEISALTGRFFAGAPGFLRAVGGATTGFLGSAVMQGVIMILAMYFFLLDGESMLESMMRLSPLDDAHERELIAEFDRISRAVVLATLLSAVVQGLLAGVGFWLCGIQSVFLLSMLTIVFALVPFVGAATVWLPAAVWLYLADNRPWAALFLVLYGAVVVSTSDNFIKPLVLQGQTNLHPLFALLSVLGGVQALGAIGILVGPMVVVFLQTLLNMLHRELPLLEGLRAVQPTPAESTKE